MEDDFPLDAEAASDADDGVDVANDAFPADASESVDSDDGVGNNADTDDDEGRCDR